MQQLRGLFPPAFTISWNTHPLVPNLRDGIGTSGTTWTTGAANIFRLPAQPTITAPWTIYGWSVQGRGVLQPGNSGPAGLLGKVLAALILEGSSVSQQVNVNYSPPSQDALSTLTTIWDGSTDPPFPFLDPTATSFPANGIGGFRTTQQLPVPQILGAGDQIALGLWLTPSLISGASPLTAIILYECAYAITYQ